MTCDAPLTGGRKVFLSSPHATATPELWESDVGDERFIPYVSAQWVPRAPIQALLLIWPMNLYRERSMSALDESQVQGQ